MKAEEKPGMDALANMPVKEITIFKDGHVFVLHENSMATDDKGNVVLDYLPANCRDVLGICSRPKGRFNSRRLQ